PPRQRFTRPVEFVRYDLKTPLWGKQAEILREIASEKRVAVRSCNGSGKTFVAATAVIWWLMAHAHTSAMVVTTAPTQHQVRDLLWREIRNLYFRNAALIGGKIGRTTLELSPRHFATGLSTDSPERFQGFHETNILFVVDEASGVHEEVFEAIEGSMTSRRVRLLLIGNPTSLSGTFYRAFHQNRAQYKTIHISAFDTPNLRPPAHNQLPLLREGAGGRVDKEGPSDPITPAPVRKVKCDARLAHASHLASAASARPELTQDRSEGPGDPITHGPKRRGGSDLPVEDNTDAETLSNRAQGTSREVRPATNRVVDPSSPQRNGQKPPENFGYAPETARVIQRQEGWNKTVIPGIVTPEWVDDARMTWGVNSTQYQVRVLGEFPTQSDDTLIPLTHIEAAISSQSGLAPAHRAIASQVPTPSDDAARPGSGPPSFGKGLGEGSIAAAICSRQSSGKSASDARSLTQDARDRTKPVQIGVDVARFGTDRTVICIRQGNRVIALDQHQKLDTMRTTGLIVKAIAEYNPQAVRIDEIGVGAGVVDRLHELNYSMVEGVNVGNRATDPEHFFNLRSELYDGLRARFEEQTIEIPHDEDLIGQLASIRIEYTSRGQLKVEPKETMRRRSLPSPDKADALLLAFAPTPPATPYRLWT
ncbi:MAG: AAA family ATPase, partial [Chloroflexi bacterium]|nr:AAA family ATPase [Chloroflexota bacterium]